MTRIGNGFYRTVLRESVFAVPENKLDETITISRLILRILTGETVPFAGFGRRVLEKDGRANGMVHGEKFFIKILGVLSPSTECTLDRTFATAPSPRIATGAPVA